MENLKSKLEDARLSILVVTVLAAACGSKKPFDTGEELGPAVLEGGGGVRSSGVVTSSSSGRSSTGPTFITVTKKRLKPKPTFNVVEVTKVVEATDDRSSWTIASLPFIPSGTTDAYKLDRVFQYGADTFFNSATNTPNSLARDGAWPFRFDYSYPLTNFQFKSAHLVVETMRDSSDTEGIFVEGVFSGRPPSGMVNTSTSAITDHVYANVGANTLGTGANKYYIDWSLTHYKRDQRNFFDLNFTDLLTGTAKTAYEMVRDGEVQAILGDDSPAYKAFLVIKGLTVSSSALSCQDAGPYPFRNTLVHNDGNSIGIPSFTGTIKPLYQAFPSPSGQTATEFYFDTMVPDTPLEKISLSTAVLKLTKAKIAASGSCPMIIINGIGIGAPSCARSTANSDVVESWDEAASSSVTWASFVTSLTTNSTGVDVNLDLISLLGASKVTSLLKQGKFNVSLAGTLVANSVNSSSTLTSSSARTYGVYVDGPELVINGTYLINTCTVVEDATSPMTESGFIDPASLPDEYEEYQEVVDASSATASDADSEASITNDGFGPVIASIQVQDITSTSATILWTTDEPATRQVSYGITSPSQTTSEETNRSTFHRVTLQGLSPYKYYKYKVTSKDQYGNESQSDIAIFTTLR